MKKLWAFVLVGALCSCASTRGSKEVELNTAIQLASKEINDSLPLGTKVALLNFNSPAEAISSYVLEEISIALVNSKKLVVVDRKEIDLIRAEMNFQLSGEVSDESAQEIGKMLGTQFIVSGALVHLSESYRFQIKVINVSSAAIETAYAISVYDDDDDIEHLKQI